MAAPAIDNAHLRELLAYPTCPPDGPDALANRVLVMRAGRPVVDFIGCLESGDEVILSARTAAQVATWQPEDGSEAFIAACDHLRAMMTDEDEIGPALRTESATEVYDARTAARAHFTERSQVAAVPD